MTNKFGLAALAVASLTLAGCVVQPIDDGSFDRPQRQPPVFNSAPPPQAQRVQIEGPWQLRAGGQFFRRIDVRRVRGGIVVETPRGRDFAQRIDRGVYRDAQGRIYQFFSSTEGRFENPNNGRRFRIVR